MHAAFRFEHAKSGLSYRDARMCLVRDRLGFVLLGCESGVIIKYTHVYGQYTKYFFKYEFYAFLCRNTLHREAMPPLCVLIVPPVILT